MSIQLKAQILQYVGSKQRMAGDLAILIPQNCTTYVEPYCGSAALALNCREFDVKVLNDYNAHIANFWKVATDPETSGELLEAILPICCGWSKFEKAKARREQYGSNRADKLQWAVDTFYLNRNSFNRQGEFWTDCEVKDIKLAQLTLKASFQQLMRQKFIVHNENALVFLKKSELLNDPDAFIYLDPPYLEGLRCNGKLYQVDMPDSRDHINLLKTIRGAKAKIILSGYWSGRDDGTDLYDYNLQGWERILLGEYTKGIETGETKSKGKEWIWMNYKTSLTPEKGGVTIPPAKRT